MNPKKQLSDMPRRYWKYMTEKKFELVTFFMPLSLLFSGENAYLCRVFN